MPIGGALGYEIVTESFSLTFSRALPRMAPQPETPALPRHIG